MPDHVENRPEIVEAVRREMVGPSPSGDEIDCDLPLVFGDVKDSLSPYRQRGSGEEILQRDSPGKRYGVGVLYPTGILLGEGVEPDVLATEDTEEQVTEEGETGYGEKLLADEAFRNLDRISRRDGGHDDPLPDDFDLSTANAFKPSSMGVSFLAELLSGDMLVVEACGGRYRRTQVHAGESVRNWWLRSPVTVNARFTSDSINSANMATVPPDISTSDNTDGLDLRVEVFSRPHNGNLRLLTICLVNRKEARPNADEYCLFQSFFEARVESTDGTTRILPYPGPPAEQLDEEEQSLALIYRRAQTFAVGHGCAADWETDPSAERARKVKAECLPRFETPSVTPDILRPDGTPLRVRMATLAGLGSGEDDFRELSEVVDLYEGWIAGKREEILALEERYRAAAERHMGECARAAARMRKGLDHLRRDTAALRAFRLANHAILLQQIRSRREPRRMQYNEDAQRIEFSEGYVDPDPLAPDSGRGSWRPFQIAFLLMNVSSVAEEDDPDRETVELIWFPTGGGKTESYFGLAAFSIFLRRLRDPSDAGVEVLMRYTLRLLTAQQFQRASGLLCAMEHLRRENSAELGETEFSIGLWLGGSTTPNRREEARASLRELNRGDSDRNPFVLTRCPWCGSQIGFVEYGRRRPRNAPRIVGYEQRGSTVITRCPDRACEFSDGLPVYVIDQDVYERRPSMVIGTVDKFALLAWRPQARSMFGLGPDGEREFGSPGLIIQDELHLISGPLGSMVGLYESVIEELCVDSRGGTLVRPKIVSSTATIRRYAEQIKALYARERVVLFPPPGLDTDDSFFARYARRPDGSLQPGRLYVGVHAPGLGSLQTVQVRALTALLQAPVPMTAEERDPWWTLMLFFNSLRELGGALSLFQSDIPDYLRVFRNRYGLGPRDIRRLYNILELTSRLQSDEVPEAISALETGTASPSGRPVDVCLASNIIEVGIDIDRLSLMAVVGQPKTTSQYIQVTGRVGRRWWERPGVVLTLYGASKPRDRSHFEKFRSYHERLYA